MDLFRLSTPVLALLLVVIVGGAMAGGVAAGRVWPKRAQPNREPVGVIQGALLGLVGLLLAFGLSMAVGRYDNRRSLVVDEANAIGTTYLRAELLDEPQRAASLDLIERYTDEAIVLAHQEPGSARFKASSARMEAMQEQLWTLAGDAMKADPAGNASRLYVETLNETIDAHSSRVASLNNRVPPSVMWLLIIGSAVALAALSLYLSLLGRGLTTSLVATAVLLVTLFVSFDLDRPVRGFITVPTTALDQARAAMTAD